MVLVVVDMNNGPCPVPTLIYDIHKSALVYDSS